MTDVLVAIALCTGTLFLLLAALAAVRMPDAYTRLSASTKAVTFGASTMFLAVAVAFAWEPSMTRALAGIAFLFATAPVGAHVLARQAHRIGQPLWAGSLADELVRDQITQRWSTPQPGAGALPHPVGLPASAVTGHPDILVVPADEEADDLLRAHVTRIASSLALRVDEVPLDAVREVTRLDQDPAGWARALRSTVAQAHVSMLAVPGDHIGLADQLTGRSRSLVLAAESSVPLFVVGPRTGPPRTGTPYRILIPATSAHDAHPLIERIGALIGPRGLGVVEVLLLGFELPGPARDHDAVHERQFAAELEATARDAAPALHVKVEVEDARGGGRLAPAIARAAASRGVDAVVLGYRHIGPLGRLLAGHTALDVLAVLPCAAFLVPLAGQGTRAMAGAHSAEAAPERRG
jgi:multicomponent Na+:H+ antiporter subunit G